MVKPGVEKNLKFPLVCPTCNSDLGQPGAVYIWEEMPGRGCAHLEEGVDGVIVVFDRLGTGLEVTIQCAQCSTYLTDFVVEDYTYDACCEIEGKEEEEDSLADG